MIHFRCPGSCRCGRTCSVEDSFANCTISCPYSGEPVRVPSKSFSERDWLSSTDPQEMLLGLPIAVPDRKLRLFGLACCQRIKGRLTHHLSRQALILAERYANELATDGDMSDLSLRFMDEYNARLGASGGNWSAVNTTDLDAAYGMTLKTFPAIAASSVVDAAQDKSEERAIQCQLLRCIFGNTFRPITIDPAWLAWHDGTVPKIAQAIYDDRSFASLPVLADALEEAGCTNADILSHCRGPGPHVKGCWAVDMVLGKE
jgi:hypothetical protein